MTAGVYAIINTENKRVYVGSSYDIEDRWQAHLSMLSRKRHMNPELKKDVAEYSLLAFKFKVLDVYTGDNIKEDLPKLETLWESLFADTYNARKMFSHSREIIGKQNLKRPLSLKTELQQMRIAYGLTQKQVADAISVSIETYRKIERNVDIAAFCQIERLAKFYNVPIETFKENVRYRV